MKSVNRITVEDVATALERIRTMGIDRAALEAYLAGGPQPEGWEQVEARAVEAANLVRAWISNWEIENSNS